MKKVLKITGIILLIPLTVGLIIFFFFPGILINQTNASYARAANLEQKTLMVDGYNVHYYENAASEKPVLVMLHGMGDDKSSFLQTAAYLSNHFRLILPDLAGHGDNEKKLGLDYSIGGQATFLKSFLKAKGMEHFSLIGNSMGGHTAAAYAIKYKQDVDHLILLNAPGIVLDEHVVYTGFGEKIKNKAELKTVLNRVFYQAPDLPGPIANYMIEQVNNSKEFVDGTLIPAIKNGPYFNLKEEVVNISSPTLVLWGKHDEVVKFNVAEFYRDHIPNATLQLLDKAAHSPQLEVPQEVAEAVVNFVLK
ncbi:hypothetical protein DNU06_15600 [Putridiphycobacter roseus]|uniref:AB hydrolase-1 domain-containing protein n=1 Tax=Putridiphycobacter roseus TaxID=2219161 RepID=A0A2W1NJY2_9FLAO|nr:alpha/beta hydrolase [Putridiphycobacter roseus]PZE15932.1 hypothetical protein DNU06_15600 [Putridiphycobacter roseus]